MSEVAGVKEFADLVVSPEPYADYRQVFVTERLNVTHVSVHPGDAVVDDLQATLAGHEEVVWRHVAMNRIAELPLRVAKLMKRVKALAGVEQPVDAVGAEHVRELVRVADRRGRAAAKNGAIEVARNHEGAFDVDMGVDEAGDHVSSPEVNLSRAPESRFQPHDRAIDGRSNLRMLLIEPGGLKL